MRHEIGNCLGPCAGGCSRTTYMAKVNQLKEFLNGEVGPVLGILQKQMSEFAVRLQFEFAGQVKQKIKTLEVFGQILQYAKDLGKLNYVYWQKLNDDQFVINIIRDGILIHSELVKHFKSKNPLSKSMIEKIKLKARDNNQVLWAPFQKLLIQRWFKKMKMELEQTLPLPKI